MDILRVALNSGVFFLALLLLDFAIPAQCRLIGYSVFKTELSSDAFHAAYRNGLRVRIGVAAILAIVMAGVLAGGDEVAWAFTLIPEILGYSALIFYHMWLADRRPDALNKRGGF